MTSKSCGGLLEDRDARDDDGLVNDNDYDGMDDSDIYYDEVFVCLFVTENDHFPLPSWAPQAQSELLARPALA